MFFKVLFFFSPAIIYTISKTAIFLTNKYSLSYQRDNLIREILLAAAVPAIIGAMLYLIAVKRQRKPFIVCFQMSFLILGILSLGYQIISLIPIFHYGGGVNTWNWLLCVSAALYLAVIIFFMAETYRMLETKQNAALTNREKQ